MHKTVSTVARTCLTLVALLVILTGIGVATAQASQAATGSQSGGQSSAKKQALRSAITSNLSELNGTVLSVEEQVTVRGTLTGRAARPVVLQVRSGQTWRPLNQTRSTRTGRFTLALPTTWYGTHQMRLVATAVRVAGAERPALYGPEATITISPDFDPAPSSRFDLTDTRRFNPCQTITWGYSTTHAPDDPAALAALRWAFGEVSRATGITFVETATTTSRAVLDGIEGTSTAPADLIVGWATSEEIALALGENYPGADPQATAPDAIQTRIAATHEATYVAGGIVLNADRYETRPAVASRDAASWQATYLHEIGRLLGLAPIHDTASVMNASGPTSAVLSTGDLNGFRAVGLAAGCR